MADHHRDMMERRLIGCDVLPSHIHLTASSLAGLHVRERFAGTRLYIMPYGKGKEFDTNAEEYRRVMGEVARLAELTKGLKKRAADAAPQDRADLNRKIKANTARIKSLRADAAPKEPVIHVRCGSLELLGFAQTRVDAFDIGSGSILAASGSGADRGVATMDIRHGSCDIVVMNPPFSSAANPEQKSDDVHNPAFAGFDEDEEAQRLMSTRTSDIAGGKIAGGRRQRAGNAAREKIVAGGKLPVYFAHIADTMLRDGGTLALVLPLAFAQGESWAPLRQKILRDYDDILLVSAAGATAEESSFSSGTGMREAVLVCKKVPRSEREKRVTFAVLRRVPRDPLAAAEIGRRLKSMRAVRPADVLAGAGPLPIRMGNDEAGNAVSGSVPADGDPSLRINCILDMSLAATAERLRGGTLRIGIKGQPVPIPMTTMDKIGEGGLLSRDIDGGGKIAGGLPRGPFTFSADTANKSYPAVHKHNKDDQSRMRMEPDGYYVAKSNAEPFQVEKAWTKSGRVIIATHWQFDAQPCVAGYVETAVLGGSTFPNFNLYCKDHEKPFVVWQNSIFGALCFWFHSTLQQIGRGIMSKDLRKTMPVLDFSALSKKKLRSLGRLFDGYADKMLRPLDELEVDGNRRSMDEDVARILFDEREADAVCGALDWLYGALASEPTVHGKAAGPTSA